MDNNADDQNPIQQSTKPTRKGPSEYASRREQLRFVIRRKMKPTEIDRYFPIWNSRFLGQKFLIGKKNLLLKYYRNVRNDVAN